MTRKITHWLLPPRLMALACFTVFARILAMVFFPLTEKTEARYGEIARKMAETNDWITPQYDYGVPFWAKPPLSTWLSAASMDAFGVSAFASRLPALLIGLALLPLVYIFSRTYVEKPIRNTAMIMLLTMGMFYVAMGTVMTDMTLLLSCTLALVAFWYALEEKSREWGYVFFAALGIGLLAKGPIALVLCGMPIFIWLFWARSWKKMFSRLPIISGSLLMLAIGVPWYILAEHKTPGFLEYFIIGEHFKRFLVPGWQGDLYGRAYMHPLGTVWLYLLAGGFPWSLILPGVWVYRYFRKKSVIAQPALDSKTKFLLCWLLLPNIFFTFAHNIIPTYPLVSLPALALLVSRELAAVTTDKKGEVRGWFYAAGMALPALTVIGLIVLACQPSLTPKTALYVSKAFHKLDADANDRLVYVGDRVYSMEFYNAGKVQNFATVEEAMAQAKKQHEAFIVLSKKQSGKVPESVMSQMKLVTSTAPNYSIYRVNK